MVSVRVFGKRKVMGEGYLSKKDRETYVKGLEHFKDKGVSIFVDGKYSSSKKEWYKILKVCDKESYYMADFVDDVSGKLKEIRFNKIKVKDSY